ncbi:hypothetical protein [Chenggangzhangella methanolivorans]|uniref:Uncharacterized protein n=1 Tax=Chenggangzhangella methanolivorans TaxID=1437009 RepID=A0A9E6RDW6_9HYPH|nr:hypothetical protein [Chenggangzhangella methanolivorans]QZN99330.1 hypothetical protein K6K41_21495 [Chenggangzhangella methanolivorans]
MRCTDKACGSERVFCLIQVRGAQDAKAGQPVSQAAAEEFGAGVIRNSPKEMAADYVTLQREDLRAPSRPLGGPQGRGRAGLAALRPVPHQRRKAPRRLQLRFADGEMGRKQA